MKKNLSIYLYFVLAFAITLVSCDDIVTYNDNYDPGTTSYGPPQISKVSLLNDKTGSIIEGTFNQMVVIQGENLSEVKSLLFNDQAVDIKEIYAISKEITVAIPGTVPDKITNTITLETTKGSTTFPFSISFPDLIVSSISHEFAAAGDAVKIYGENFKLYNITPENGTLLVNGNPATIITTSETELEFILPTGVVVNSKLSMSSERLLGVIGHAVEIPYFDYGIQLTNFRSSDYLTHSSTKAYATDGSNAGDPSPLIPGTYFSHFKLDNVGGWAWKNIIAGFTYRLETPEELDVVASPNNYYLKFELYIDEANAIDRTSTQFIPNVSGLTTGWYPAANGNAYHTSGRWTTVTLDLATFNLEGTGPVAGDNVYNLAYISGELTNPNLSCCNFRLAKKFDVK
ncbi:glycan-binding surface protein [Prevotella sp. 10(H)]|uniref:glycan-binding surface protein n=1 Tax=Prevotella sp. 10(H) TaxID=1158294 RepID=UPI0004A735F6|nr:glycan-binding surface protein [Prevotella sp. 10(H)]